MQQPTQSNNMCFATEFLIAQGRALSIGRARLLHTFYERDFESIGNRACHVGSHGLRSVTPWEISPARKH
jgi:hypothetical protein